MLIPFYNRTVRPVICVFAKAARPGHVKTRLLPALTAERAAELHRAFVETLLGRVLTLDAAVELHTDVPSGDWLHPGIGRRLQAAGDLGERMLHALKGGLAGGVPVAILGADSPDLPLAHVSWLLQSEADVGFGPAEDGGYWGIVARRVHPEMFRGVNWSTATALDDSLRATRDAGLSTALGPTWYDVDFPADLERLSASAELPEALRELVRSSVRLPSH